METIISRPNYSVAIGEDNPTVLIGERLNPTGKKGLTEAIRTGNMDKIVAEAVSQVAAGADVLDINVGVSGVDEVGLLPDVVQLVMEMVQVPLCIDSNDPKALEAALKVYEGKALINSVSGEEASLAEVLPLAKEYGAAVIGLPMDEQGIPQTPLHRLRIAEKIAEKATLAGVPLKDLIMDCLATPLGADGAAGVVTLETIRLIQETLELNMTLGASNISFGLPDRGLINSTFLTAVIIAGVNCPIVDAAKGQAAAVTSDLIMNKDEYGRRYIQRYRDSLKQ